MESSPAPRLAEPQKILFLAGPRDHGAPGRHEYERDLRTLAQSFENASNLKGVTTQLIVGKAPRDLALFEDVAAIVIDSSSDRAENETHPLFPQNPSTNYRGYDAETTAYLKSLDELHQAEQDRRRAAALRHLGRELARARVLPQLDRRPVGADRHRRTRVDDWAMKPLITGIPSCAA